VQHNVSNALISNQVFHHSQVDYYGIHNNPNKIHLNNQIIEELQVELKKKKTSNFILIKNKINHFLLLLSTKIDKKRKTQIDELHIFIK
jgi:hypothetical protein